MKTIEQMAVDAGFDCVYGGRGSPPGVGKVYPGHFDNEEIDLTAELQRFAALVAARCAEICASPTSEQLAACTSSQWDSLDCADAILAEFTKP